MDPVSIIAVSVALAMDAFSVCISCGIAIPKPGFGHYFRLSFHFGLFQFMMPVIGYLGGMHLERYIRAYDHWLSFGLLMFIGLKMLHEAFTKKIDDRCVPARDPTRGVNLVVLSVATSIDALAVGISIGVMNQRILLPSVVIGVVCALFSLLGVAIGNRVGPLFGRRSEAIGGIALVAIGIKILAEHLLG